MADDPLSVSLVTSGAPLLSGDLNECLSPDDSSCVGGVVTVAALSRLRIPEADVLFPPLFDKQSAAVSMHPIGWVLNRLVLLALLKLTLYISKPSVLIQNAVDASVSASQRDLSGVQDPALPFLLTNVAVPPTNSWHAVSETVHFDRKTQIALLSIDHENSLFSTAQIESATAALTRIAIENLRNGCRMPSASDASIITYEKYLSGIQSDFNFDPIGDQLPASNQVPGLCWTSVVLYTDVLENFEKFLGAVARHHHPPQLIVYLEDTDSNLQSPQKYEGTNVWISHCAIKASTWCHHRLEFDSGSDDRFTALRSRPLKNVALEEIDMRKLDAELDARVRADPQWRRDITVMRRLAEDASSNNPVVGTLTEPLPVARSGSLRMCKAGECPIGNLYADALHWMAEADFAFTGSGGYRGSGTGDATSISISDLYSGLPFPNTLCTGVMSGVSVYKLLNYSTSLATFEAENSDLGGILVQLSFGLRVVYNTEWTVDPIRNSSNNTRLVSIDIWDQTMSMYQPLRWTKLYKFATDSFNCGSHEQFPYLTGESLSAFGEEPGVVEDVVIQNIASDYLQQLDGPYNTSIQGRLVNDTMAAQQMEFVLSLDCNDQNSRFDENAQECVPCPSHSNVAFSDSHLTFAVEKSNSSQPMMPGEIRPTPMTSSRVLLVNREPYQAVVQLRSQPSWLIFTKIQISNNNQTLDSLSASLQPGESLVLEFEVNPGHLDAGTTTIEQIVVGVQDTTTFTECAAQDTTLVIEMRVHPHLELNQLGNVRYFGLSLFGLIAGISVFFASWVIKNRDNRVIKIMQPLFLGTVCVGVFVLSTVLIPLSLDDSILSERGCDIACVSIPWLLCMGFTTAFAGLFSKLWRVNRLFNHRNGFQRVVVNTTDVMAPFVVLFTANFILLIISTIVDPPRWERRSVPNEEWNTFGICAGGTVRNIIFILLLVCNIGALFLACFEAYMARNISEEFSESKYIGVAVYGWFQILAVALPVVFLIDQDNPSALYFLKATVVFIFSLSVLLIIFVPAAINLKRRTKEVEENGGMRRRVTVTGLNLPSQVSVSPHQLEAYLEDDT